MEDMKKFTEMQISALLYSLWLMIVTIFTYLLAYCSDELYNFVGYKPEVSAIKVFKSFFDVNSLLTYICFCLLTLPIAFIVRLISHKFCSLKRIIFFNKLVELKDLMTPVLGLGYTSVFLLMIMDICSKDYNNLLYVARSFIIIVLLSIIVFYFPTIYNLMATSKKRTSNKIVISIIYIIFIFAPILFIFYLLGQGKIQS